MMMTRLARRLALLMVLMPVLAAGQAADAILTGAIKDTTGGVLPGVTVTTRNVATNELRSAVSSAEGVYRITNLPRGRYEVKAEIPGFKTIAQSDVLLTVGDTVRLDFALEVGSLSEVITVVSQAALVNTEEGRISSLVDEKRVSELPLNGRNVFQLIELQPGAVGNPGNVVLGGTAGGNSAFVNGQRNRANNFLLDGTDNNDQFTAGRPAVNPNVDMVQEFRVLANNFSAEFGRNSASVVNVVTKSRHQRACTARPTSSCATMRSTPRPCSRPRRTRSSSTSSAPPPADRSCTTGRSSSARTRGCARRAASRSCARWRRRSSGSWSRSATRTRLRTSSSGTSRRRRRPATSAIRASPCSGWATDNRLNTPGIATNPNYALTSGNVYRNVLQATPDGIPDHRRRPTFRSARRPTAISSASASTRN